MSKLKLRLDDQHTRDVWVAVQAAKAEVASWPAWKRGDVEYRRSPVGSSDMARPKKTQEDKFEYLPEDFRETIRSLDRDQIKLRIAQVTLDQLELMLAQKEDQHYQELKEEFKEAGAIYRDGTKMNGLKIAFAKQVLEDKGGL